ncbi:small GTPase superfamily [Polychytrium aggregatum]|uniref:small GTPase superfamily n=1 Tax=Polychytrium aggregatum TaxID=110093 RepID=UPI0022FE692E|nr:small GTPase superfamily [Polychytrium aggregatum]KAI9205829.1 small GTPase superfamily [Polychytrium aggregatum]
MTLELMRARKIAVLGSRAVGKSSMTIQFVENHFADTYYPTIENTFHKLVRYRNQDYDAEIIDTAGQDEYSILNSKHAIGIHGYVLVYSIASRQSFEMCHVVRDKILNYTGIDWVPIVLVGNKADLSNQRQVPTEEATRVAIEWNCAFIESSAKHNQNIGKIFELVLGEIEKQGLDSEPPRTSGCLLM